MSIKNVELFYKRLSTDKVFSSHIQEANKEEFSRVVKAAGYDFTQQEFEDYTADLLDGDLSKNVLGEIGERELEAVQGGFMTNNSSSVQIYGSVVIAQ
jgi:predicted ribosomally synthesized peptide with nif11-like leader